MVFEQKGTDEKIGIVVGFIFMYFVFTTILFYILILLEKLPKSWNYFYIMIITAIVVLIGFATRKYIK